MQYTSSIYWKEKYKKQKAMKEAFKKHIDSNGSIDKLWICVKNIMYKGLIMRAVLFKIE